MQNLPNMLLSTSTLLISPVMLPKQYNTSLRSCATNSVESPDNKPSLTRINDSEAFFNAS